MNEYVYDLESFDKTKLSCHVVDHERDQWVVITHGVGEHSQRHLYWLKELGDRFNYFLYDLRGHGKSQGERGNVEKFEDFVKDLDKVLEYVEGELKAKSFVLFGHSMGGLIVSRWVQQNPNRNFYPSKVILSAPAAGAYGALGKLTRNVPQKIYEQLLKMPTVKVSGILDLKKLSHRIEVYEDYINDPLNLLKLHTHLFLEILQTAKSTYSKSLNCRCPLLVLIGSEDVLVDRHLVIEYFSKLKPSAKLVVVSGGYHELHNEETRYSGEFFKELSWFLLSQDL